MNRRCVIIGGTFNPVTVAHIKMGQAAKELLPDADIFFVPSNMEYMKEWKDIDSDAIFWSKSRLEFLELAIEGNEDFKVSDIEITGLVDGRSYNTVQYFLASYEEVYWGMGADKLTEVERWYRAEDFVNAAKILLFSRDNIVIDFNSSDFLREHKDRFRELMIKLPGDISSSKIREEYASGELASVKHMLDERVYKKLID